MVKRFVIAVAVLLFCAESALAQNQAVLTTGRSQSTVLVTFSCEGVNCAGLIVDATVGGVTLTAAKYNPVVADQPAEFSRAQSVYCTNNGAKIWYTTVPGVTLATTLGQPVLDTGSFTIYGYANIVNFRAIRDAAVSSTLRCDYSRQP